MLRVYAVYDSKVEAYMQPFFSRTTGEATRHWEQVCNDGQSIMSQYPADFTLMEIGTYDEKKGRIEALDANRSIATALEVKRAPKEDAPFLSKIR